MGNGDIPLYGGPSDCFIKICLNTHKKDRVSFGTGKDYCLLQSEGSTKSRMQHAPLPPATGCLIRWGYSHTLHKSHYCHLCAFLTPQMLPSDIK